MRIPPKLVPIQTPLMEPVLPPPGLLDELYWAVAMDQDSDWSNDEVIQKAVRRLLQDQWNDFKRFAIDGRGEPIESFADFTARKNHGYLQGRGRCVELWALSEVLCRPLVVHLHDKPGYALFFSDPRSKHAADQGDDLHLLLDKDRRFYLLQPAVGASRDAIDQNLEAHRGACIPGNDPHQGEFQPDAPRLRPRRAPENVPQSVTPPGSGVDFSSSAEGAHDHSVYSGRCLEPRSRHSRTETELLRYVSRSSTGNLVVTAYCLTAGASSVSGQKTDAWTGSASVYNLTAGPASVSDHPKTHASSAALCASAGSASVTGLVAGPASASRDTAFRASAASTPDCWWSDCGLTAGLDAASGPLPRPAPLSCSSSKPPPASSSSTSSSPGLRSASGGPSHGGPCNDLGGSQLISDSACGLSAPQDSASADCPACSSAAATPGPPYPPTQSPLPGADGVGNDASRWQTAFVRKLVQRDCYSLYRCLSLAWYGTELHYAYIREEVMCYVKENWENDFGEFGLFPSLTDYLEKSSRSDYRCSVLELSAACKLYRIRIVVHNGVQTVTLFEPPETKDDGESHSMINIHLLQMEPFFHLLVPRGSDGGALMAAIASRSSSAGPPPPPPLPSLDHTTNGAAASPPVSRSQAKKRRAEEQDCGWDPPARDPESFLSHPPPLLEQSAWPGAEAGSARPRSSKEGLVPVGVGGDGNCLFRSLSMARFGTQEYHLGVRAEIINYVKQHWEDDLAEFAVDCRGQPFASLAAYLAQRACPGNYCGALEVLAASRIYGLRFVIHSKDDDIAFNPPHVQSDERGARQDFLRTVHLGFAGSRVAGHYSLLVPCGSPLAVTRPRGSGLIWDCLNSSMWFSSKDNAISSSSSRGTQKAGASGGARALGGAPDDTDSSPCQGGASVAGSVNAAPSENSNRNSSDGDGNQEECSNIHNQGTKRPLLSNTSATPAPRAPPPMESWPGAVLGVVSRSARELQPIPVDRDGDSLFRALSLARFGTDEHHVHVRGEVMSLIVEHWQIFSSIAFDTRDRLFRTVDAYLERHGYPGSPPCGALEVRAASRLYRVRIAVYRIAGCPSRPVDPVECVELEKGSALQSVYLGLASSGSRITGFEHYYCLLVAANCPLAGNISHLAATGRIPRGGGGGAPKGRRPRQWWRH